MVSWSEQFCVSPSEGGSELLLVFQPFTCLLGGNCCLRLQMFWVVSVAAQTNQLFNPLFQSELPGLSGLSRPEFDQSNFADLENLYPNTDFIRNKYSYSVCVPCESWGLRNTGEEPISVSACWQFCFVCSLTVWATLRKQKHRLWNLLLVPVVVDLSKFLGNLWNSLSALESSPGSLIFHVVGFLRPFELPRIWCTLKALPNKCHFTKLSRRVWCKELGIQSAETLHLTSLQLGRMHYSSQEQVEVGRNLTYRKMQQSTMSMSGAFAWLPEFWKWEDCKVRSSESR